MDIASYLLNDSATLVDLGVDLFMDTSKGAAATSISVASGLLAAEATAGAVILPIGAGMVLGVAVSLGLDYLDNEYAVTEKLKRWGNRQVDTFERHWRFMNSPRGVFFLMNRMEGWE